jgi:hypothetical protein
LALLKIVIHKRMQRMFNGRYANSKIGRVLSAAK